MIKKKNNIIVCVPFLNHIGGTELEAILTAVHFYDSKHYSKVAIFSPTKNNVSIFKEVIGERNISFLHYPTFFGIKSISFLNKALKKVGLRTSFFEYLYWLYHSTQYKKFFILTYPGCVYFFPLFQFYNSRKKYVGKITMWHFKELPLEHNVIYDKFNVILVFNEQQKEFWEQKMHLKTTKALDIMILNEKNLLKIPEKSFENRIPVFGYLGRISKEKNLEDMINLIDFLNTNHQIRCKLIIQGEGDLIYYEKLKILILKRNLSHFIDLNYDFISPLQTHRFYELIDVFLVTSKIEGGPMTALEAAAAGCYVLGYEIGAMQERFGKFPGVVNNSFESLCNSALELLNMNATERKIFLQAFRDFYITKLSNADKGYKLNQFFES